MSHKFGLLRVVKPLQPPVPYDANIDTGDWELPAVPEGKCWRVVTFAFHAIASAVVGNRALAVLFTDGQGLLDAQVFANMTAGQHLLMVMNGQGVGGPLRGGITSRDSFVLQRDLWLPPTGVVRGYMTVPQVGDLFADVRFTVIEYDIDEVP